MLSGVLAVVTVDLLLAWFIEGLVAKGMVSSPYTKQEQWLAARPWATDVPIEYLVLWQVTALHQRCLVRATNESVTDVLY